MADTIAALIVKLIADTTDMVTGTKAAETQLTAVAAAAESTSGRFSSLATGLGNADKTLALFGVHLTPQIHALQEMSEAVGKTTSDLGLFGTASVAAGAALGGWSLGRWIADLTGADQKIGDLTAKLLGLGDVAAETAAAKMDVLRNATQLAGREIANYDEAVRIVTEHAQQLAAALNTPEARLKALTTELATAERQFRSLSDAQEKDILMFVQHHVSIDDLAKAYGVLPDAIQLVIDREKLRQDQQKIAVQLQKQETDALIQATEGWKKFADQTAQISKLLTQSIKADSQARMFAMDQEILKVAQLKASLEASFASMTGQASAGGGDSFTARQDAINGKYNAMLQQAQAAPASPLRDQTIGQLEQNRAFELSQLAITGGRVPGFANGGIGDFGRGTLAVLHGREAIIPLDKVGGGLGGQTVHVHMNGLLVSNSPAARAELADFIKEAVFSAARGSRKF